jgi:4-amino-4-deoxy-L-arabinose transferase-like glycosyltransferase
MRLLYRFCVERSDRDELTYLQRIDSPAHIVCSTKENHYFFIIFIGRLFRKLGYDPNISLRIVNLLFSLIWIYLMYLIAQLLFEKKMHRLLVVFFCSFNPYLARTSMMVLREPIYLFFLTLSIYYSLLFIKSRIDLKYSFIIPLIFVFAFWCRYEGVEVLAVYFLTTLFLFVKRLFARPNGCFLFLLKHYSICLLLSSLYVYILFRVVPYHFYCFKYFVNSHAPYPVF